jgi:hypothetical protein
MLTDLIRRPHQPAETPHQAQLHGTPCNADADTALCFTAKSLMA